MLAEHSSPYIYLPVCFISRDITLQYEKNRCISFTLYFIYADFPQVGNRHKQSGNKIDAEKNPNILYMLEWINKTFVIFTNIASA